jgi:hypothetical protein
MSINTRINNLAIEIYEHNFEVGWWIEPVDLDAKFMLVVSEVAEATEGERKGLMDDKLPHRRMGEVEMADVFIRVLDIGGRLDLRFYEPTGMAEYTSVLEEGTVYSKHLQITKMICRLHDALLDQEYPLSDEERRAVLNATYTPLLLAIKEFCYDMEYDLFGAMEEKREFNRTRSDHKLENRMAPGGKSV